VVPQPYLYDLDFTTGGLHEYRRATRSRQHSRAELGDEGLIHQHCGLHVQVGQEQLDQPFQSLTDPGALSRPVRHDGGKEGKRKYGDDYHKK